MTGFWNSDTYQIVKAMKATGNKPGVVAQWKAAVEQWALSAVNDPDAVAVRAWLPLWQVRPYYTAAELAPIFPALAVALGLRKTMLPALSPALLERQLDFSSLSWFKRDGQKYFLVEKIHNLKREIENAK